MSLGAGTAELTSKGAIQAAGGIGSGLAIAAHAAWAVPVIGGVVAGVTLALTLLFGRKGPRQKQEASRIADEAEKQLQANLQGYLSGPRTRESQAAALANFDFTWAQLTGPDFWGNPALGEPGQRAIAERGPSGNPPWGNWFVRYRDPIAQDTPASGSALSMPDIAGALQNNQLAWILPAAAAVALIAAL